MAHLLFDVFGTLLDPFSLTCTCPEISAAQSRQLVDELKRQMFETAMFGALVKRYRDFDRLSAEALDQTLARLGLGGNETLRSRLGVKLRMLEPFAEAAPALTTLVRSDHVLGVLANGSHLSLDENLQAAHLRPFLTYILSGEEAGSYKPDPLVYALGTKHLRLRAGEIWFVSANWWDAAGAKCFGYRVCWINRNGESFPEDYPAPDHEVTHLGRLVELIQ